MIASVPDEMDLRLERAGEYQPEMDDPAAQLTDRQKEIVRTAIAMGYYDIPRVQRNVTWRPSSDCHRERLANIFGESRRRLSNLWLCDCHHVSSVFSASSYHLCVL